MLAALLGWARRKDYARDKRISSKCGSRMADQTRVAVQKAQWSLCEDQGSRAAVAARPAGGSHLLTLYSWSLSHPWECALDTPVEGRPREADCPRRPGSPALSSHRALRASMPHQALPTPFSHPLLLPASIHSSKYLLRPTRGW